MAITAEALAKFRAQVPACNLALWSDIRSGTVLAVDGALEHPQEYLDAFSSMAAQALSLAGPNARQDMCVLAASATELRIFATGSAMPDVALTCLAALHADVEHIKRAATSLMAATHPKGTT